MDPGRPAATAFDRPAPSTFARRAPVFAVVLSMAYLYLLFTFVHTMRLVSMSDHAGRGWYQSAVFHGLTILVVFCFCKCIWTLPGTIPDGSGWDLSMESEELRTSGNIDANEKKRTGELRHCKWCLKYKPDRCHHCRVCNQCILKMDHHCPWVYNCIGFKNHKYFFLLLIYASIDLMIVWWCMFESAWWSTRIDVSISLMACMIIGEILASFMWVLTVLFLAFHIWLMLKAMTTVEFCEKSLKKSSYNSSVYSISAYANVCSVLGPKPWLWFVPVAFPEGDGLSWPTPLMGERSASAPGASSSNAGAA